MQRKRLCTDASRYGLGVALLQFEGEDKGWLPVGFASRKMKGAEPRYTTTEKECLAVVFGLRKFRHLLHGEDFEVVTDHIALTWLLSLRKPKERLPRWIVEIQTFGFEILYKRGDGELMAVPDALSRDTMDSDLALCHRCLEVVQTVVEDAELVERGTMLEADEVRAAQERQYGADGAGIEGEDCLKDEDGVWRRVFGENDVRVIMPTELREKVLQKLHGSKASGHWCVLRTAAMVRTKYYWKGRAADVEAAVAKCMACEMVRLKKPGRQGRMMKYHPSRRFELVAVDILEMTPVTRRGNRKILVMGDMFSRFIMAVAMKDEKAETVARILFKKWITIFGPPEYLLSDRGRNFTGELIENLCKNIGTKTISTSAYHPQINGLLNGTIRRYARS
jgi:RNase H-like domain found in reverse transcriptase/Integrase zinc binding domain/Integrase core domain